MHYFCGMEKKVIIPCAEYEQLNRNILFKSMLLVVMLLGIFSGDPFLFSQTPFKVVATINGDPTSNMGFNWTTIASVTTGRVEIVQGHDKNHADFTTSNIVNTTHATRTTHNSNSVFKAVASGFAPGTPYSYRVGDGTNWSDIGTFTTSKNDKSDFTFLYTTDMQAITPTEFAVAALTTQAATTRYPNMNFWLSCGDHVDLDEESDWADFFTAQQPYFSKLPFATVNSNHDVSGTNAYQHYFNTPTSTFSASNLQGSVYSFVYGDVLFMAVSFEESSTTYLNNLAAWMGTQVANNPDVRWRIVYSHRPFFTGAYCHTETEYNPVGIRNIFMDLYDDWGIDLHIQGHDHIYEVIGPVSGTKELVPGNPGDPGTAYDRENVALSVSLTGYKGGKYNVDTGTLFFLNSAAGRKRFDPRALNTLYATDVPNYASLFTGLFIQPDAPTFSHISVTTDEITIATYIVNETTGDNALFDEFKVVKTPLFVPADNADLRSLTVSDGTLTPSFNADITSYTVHVANGVTNITVMGEANHAGSSVSGAVAGKALAVGENTVTITVTAENGTTAKIYTVTIIRAEPITSAKISNMPSIRMYPNPTNGMVTVEFEAAGFYIVTLADMTGKVLLRQTFTDQLVWIDLATISEGVYLITIDDGKRQCTLRIIRN